MKVILITVEKVAYEYEIETRFKSVEEMMDNVDILPAIQWQDTRFSPHAKLFIFNIGLTSELHYRQAVYTESPIHYISGPVFEPASN